MNRFNEIRQFCFHQYELNRVNKMRKICQSTTNICLFRIIVLGCIFVEQKKTSRSSNETNKMEETTTTKSDNKKRLTNKSICIVLSIST